MWWSSNAQFKVLFIIFDEFNQINSSVDSGIVSDRQMCQNNFLETGNFSMYIVRFWFWLFLQKFKRIRDLRVTKQVKSRDSRNRGFRRLPLFQSVYFSV